MAKTLTTRRGGRPKSENPVTDRRMVNFTKKDGRRLNRYMRQKGIDADAELLRQLVLELLDREGIEDPGPDSIEGLPVRRTIAPRTAPREEQLALTPA